MPVNKSTNIKKRPITFHLNLMNIKWPGTLEFPQTVTRLKRLLGPQTSLLDNWISISDTDINKRFKIFNAQMYLKLLGYTHVCKFSGELQMHIIMVWFLFRQKFLLYYHFRRNIAHTETLFLSTLFIHFSLASY